MSFVFNDSQQLSLFDKLAFLSPRMKKMLSLFIVRTAIPGLMHR